MSDAPTRPVTFAIPATATVTSCRSCGSEIVWIVTAAGKRMPVETGEDGPRGESHFAHCAQADMWRRDR